MKSVLAAAGRRFLAVFLTTFVVFVSGGLNSLNGSIPEPSFYGSLALAAAFASVAAALRALTEFVPFLSFGRYVPQPWGAYLDAFVQGGLGALLVTLPAWFDSADLTTWRAALSGIVVGVLTAAFRALEGSLTKGEVPAKNFGLAP